MKKFLAIFAACAALVSVASACGKSEKDDETVSVNSISLSLESMELVKGDVQELKATISTTPANASGSVEVNYKSSDTSVATVEGGKVTGVGRGTATITATAGNKTATCVVVVTEAYEGWWEVSDVDVNECTYQSVINNNKNLLTNYAVLVVKHSDTEAYAYLFNTQDSKFIYAFAGDIQSDTKISKTEEESSSRTVLGKTVTTVTGFTFEFNMSSKTAGTLTCLYSTSLNGTSSTLADVDMKCVKSEAPSGYTEGSESSMSISEGVPSLSDIKNLLGK